MSVGTEQPASFAAASTRIDRWNRVTRPFLTRGVDVRQQTKDRDASVTETCDGLRGANHLVSAGCHLMPIPTCDIGARPPNVNDVSYNHDHKQPLADASVAPLR